MQSPPLVRTLRDLVWVSGQKLSSHGRHLFTGFKLIPQICLSVGGGRTCRLRPEITLPHAFSQAVCLSTPASESPGGLYFPVDYPLFKSAVSQTMGHKARDNQQSPQHLLPGLQLKPGTGTGWGHWMKNQVGSQIKARLSALGYMKSQQDN